MKTRRNKAGWLFAAASLAAGGLYIAAQVPGCIEYAQQRNATVDLKPCGPPSHCIRERELMAERAAE